jgi:phage portal protein BeeE
MPRRLLARSRAAVLPRPRANGSLGQITFPADPMLAVSREAALSLSVVANARLLIVGIASQLSVDRLRGDAVLDPGTILTQPDPDSTWPTDIGATVDDLMFYGEAYWLVLSRDSDGYPSRARRLPWSAVAPVLDADWSKLYRVQEYSIAGVTLAPRDVIHFTMPGLGILRESAAVILDALELANAARRFTSVPLPAGVLTNTGQEVGEDDAKTIVAGFDAARLRGETAFLQGMTYDRTAFNSADLQMIEAQATMDARLARICNMPVSLVAASPTGGASAQLYANVVAAFTQVVQGAIAPYLVAIEQTFSGQGVTPRGQRVAFDTGDWLRFAQVASPSPGLNTPTSPGGTEVQ